MTLRFEDLSAAIERNDVRAVVYLLHGASEADRHALNAKVRTLAKRNWDYQGNRAAAAIAALGTVAGVRQASEILRVVSLGDWISEAVAVLEDRKPSWLSDLPKALLTGNDFLSQWPFVRALVRTRLIPKPDIAEYTTQMPPSLSRHLMHKPSGELAGKSLEEQLLADPELLIDEIFRLFHVEGAGKSLYWADAWIDQPRQWQEGKWIGAQRRPEATWRATLARLARRGQIEFDRLLDECIGAFLRDLKPTQLGWYVGMHDELAPTLDEMAARASLYERVLAADASIGVGLGQKVLDKLVEARRLDLESLVRASGPALARAEKGIVVKQLKMLGQAVKQRPDLAPLVGEVLAPALTHERPEIREAARAFADRLPVARPSAVPATAATPALLEPAQDELATIARARHLIERSEWTEQIRSSLDALEAGSPPPVWTVPVGPGRTLPPPLTEPEQVVEAFTRLVENASDPILIERAMAGAVRTGRLPVEQRRRMSEPLAKRAREQLPGWPSGLTSGDVRAMVASVAYTWSTGTRVSASFEGNYVDFAIRHSPLDEHLQPVTPTGVLAVRCIEAIDLIASGAATELLAEPTNDRGAIDPNAFIDRAQNSFGGWFGPSPARFDLETAALRIRPGTLDDMERKLPRAIRDRLIALLRDVAAWIEAEVVSGKPEDRFRNTGSVVVLARVPQIGSRSTILKRLTDLGDPVRSYVRLSDEGEFTTAYGSAIRTWPLITPWLPELTAAHLLRPLSRALQPGKHDHGPAAVSSLFHPDTPLGSVGHVALAMGCIGAEGDTRTAAGDVFAAAAKDGRLQPALMADAWLELARAGAFQARRLESTLRPISNLPASGLRMAQTLQLALGPLLEAGVRDMHTLVRLAGAVGEIYGVFPDASRLAGEERSGTELSKALRALAKVRDSSGTLSRTASVELLGGLLERAQVQ
jgi:hypothetical protein